jgi:hypothetical protein
VDEKTVSSDEQEGVGGLLEELTEATLCVELVRERRDALSRLV